jgi:hypothetical protein
MFGDEVEAFEVRERDSRIPKSTDDISNHFFIVSFMPPSTTPQLTPSSYPSHTVRSGLHLHPHLHAEVAAGTRTNFAHWPRSGRASLHSFNLATYASWFLNHSTRLRRYAGGAWRGCRSAAISIMCVWWTEWIRLKHSSSTARIPRLASMLAAMMNRSRCSTSSIDYETEEDAEGGGERGDKHGTAETEEAEGTMHIRYTRLRRLRLALIER